MVTDLTASDGNGAARHGAGGSSLKPRKTSTGTLRLHNVATGLGFTQTSCGRYKIPEDIKCVYHMTHETAEGDSMWRRGRCLGAGSSSSSGGGRMRTGW